MPLQVAQSLIPGTPNTPLDARSVVSTLADILTIELPYVGLRVYCIATGKEYRITGLKAKTIGPLSVENAAVDTYEEIGESSFSGNYNDLSNKPALFSGNYNDLSNKPALFSGNYNDLSNKPTLFSIQYLQVMVPTFSPNDATIHLVIEKQVNSSWTTIVDTSTSAGAARCTVDHTFDAVTTSGFYGYQGGLTAFVSLTGLNLANGDKLRLHWTPATSGYSIADSPYYPFIYGATAVGPMVEDLRKQVNDLAARIVALESASQTTSQS